MFGQFPCGIILKYALLSPIILQCYTVLCAMRSNPGNVGRRIAVGIAVVIFLPIFAIRGALTAAWRTGGNGFALYPQPANNISSITEKNFFLITDNYK